MRLFLTALLSIRRFVAREAPSDVELIRRTLDGDAAAGQALARRVAPAIRARVLRHTRGRAVHGHSVEDLVHEVWCRLLAHDGRRLRGYDPAKGKTLDGYVSMIASQVLANVVEQHSASKRRAAGGVGDLEEAQHTPAVEPGPERLVADRQRMAALWQHLEGSLPERGRLVLRLVYVDGMSVDEAAACLGVQRQVVYNWQFKIRREAGGWLEKIEQGVAVDPDGGRER